MTPDAMRLREALAQSAPLARLAELMRESGARFDAVRGALPDGLAPHVRPGPLDDNEWSLLVSSAAVGAKLRQLQPRLEQAMRAAGWSPRTIRIKVAR